MLNQSTENYFIARPTNSELKSCGAERTLAHILSYEGILELKYYFLIEICNIGQKHRLNFRNVIGRVVLHDLNYGCFSKRGYVGWCSLT